MSRSRRSAAGIAAGLIVLFPFFFLLLSFAAFASPYGIFAHVLTNNGETPLVPERLSLNEAVWNLTREFADDIEYYQSQRSLREWNADGVRLTINGSDIGSLIPDNWVDVLAVFSVKCCMHETKPLDVIELDEERVARLRKIFRDMNPVRLSVHSETQETVSVDPETGEVKTETIVSRLLNIDVTDKSWLRMITEYRLTAEEEAVLEEIMTTDLWNDWNHFVRNSLGSAASLWTGTLEYADGGMNIPVLYQFNYRRTICTVDGIPRTVASSGCGATSASMVIAYLTGDMTQTPYSLLMWTYNHGYYTGDGLGHGAISRICSLYGVDVDWVANTSANIIQALTDGHPVIAHMGPGTFTNGGHYIVLRGLTDTGLVLVNDPNSADRTKRAWPLSLFLKEARRDHCFGVCTLSESF